MTTLILFDIDGTLLASNGVGRAAMKRALAHVVGSGDCLDAVDMAGRCDWGIWRAALGVEDYSPDEVDAQLPDLFRRYVAELAYVLADRDHPDPEVLPGVRPLLDALHARDDVLLGLLTGNVEGAAWLKLGKVGLDRYFRFGAFGSDAPDRPALPAIAVARARPFVSGYPFEGEHIVIIGDTVHDVRCGEALGVRAIGVATGRTDAATLREAGAAHVFPSLADHEAVLRALLSEGTAGQRGGG